METALTATDRRTFLRTLSAGAAGWLLADRLSASTGPGDSSLDRIGVQLYTVRDAMAKDFEGTLGKVAAIGYKEVEFAGYFDRSPKEIRAILDRNALTSPAAHVPITALGNAWPVTLDAANAIGHEYLVVAWTPAEERQTLDAWHRIAERFSIAAVQARQAGIGFAYHNHDYEFVPMEGRTPFDVLLAETDPKLVLMEMDLYWITKAGRNPLDYFAKYPGRTRMVHVKDSKGPPDHVMTEVGAGTIDFRRIFAQRKLAGIEHFFVEHDEPADPFASIRASYQYLRNLRF